jgi:hypothetical protein
MSQKGETDFGKIMPNDHKSDESRSAKLSQTLLNKNISTEACHED